MCLLCCVSVCNVCCVVCPDRGSGSSEGEAEQHQQGDGLRARAHVGEAEAGLVAAVPPLGGLELQQVQRQHGGRYDGELTAQGQHGGRYDGELTAQAWRTLRWGANSTGLEDATMGS